MLLALVAALCSMTKTNAKMLRSNNNMVLDQRMESMEEMKARLGQVTVSGSMKTTQYVCGMLSLSFGGVLELSVGLGLEVTVGISSGQQGEKEVTLSGMVGGGITIGPSIIFSAAGYVQHKVSISAIMPRSLHGGSAWQAMKWAVMEWYNKKKPGSKLGKITSQAKMLTALKAMRVKIGDATSTRTNMARQARHGFELFGGQYTQFLQGARPTKEKYLEGVQRAFWISHMSEAPEDFVPNPVSGAKGTSAPDCAKVHEKIMDDVSKQHKTFGYFNLLCVFMTHGTLLQDGKLADGLLATKGYKNVLDMVPVVFDGLFPQDDNGQLDLDAIYGDARHPNHKDEAVEDWLKDLNLFEMRNQKKDKPNNPAEPRILLRAIASLLIQTPNDFEGAISKFADTNALPQGDAQHGCDSPANKQFNKCGIASWTVETTWTGTLGWGGGINLCTPDTSVFQYNHVHKRVFTRRNDNTYHLDSDEYVHKATLAGSIFFMLDIAYIKDAAKNEPKPHGYEVTVRITIPMQLWGAGDAAGGNGLVTTAEGTGAAFEQFFAKDVVNFAGQALPILINGGVGGLGIRAALKELSGDFNDKVKKSYTAGIQAHKIALPGDVQISADSGEVKHGAHMEAKAGKAPKQSEEKKAENTLAKVISVPVILGVVASKPVQDLGKGIAHAVTGLFKNLSPVSGAVVTLNGIELTVKLDSLKPLKFKGAQGAIFSQTYYEGKAGTAPWGSTGIGMDVSAAGYAGSLSRFEINFDSDLTPS